MTVVRAAFFACLTAVVACSPAPAPFADADAATDASPSDARADRVAPDARVAQFTVVPTGARTTRAIAADVGGTLTLAGAAHTYALEITPGALVNDAPITLEEVTIRELPGAVAVRFAPDGLVFRVPALLRVDAPSTRPMLALAFRAGTAALEVSHAAPEDGGLAMQIAHFSEAAFVPPAEAEAALDDSAVTTAAAITELQRSQAIGLGALISGRITRLVARAGLRVVELEAASRALQSARAEMMAHGLEHFDARPSGPPTVGASIAALLAAFETNARALHAKLTQPTCTAGRDVIDLDDWARAVHRLRAALAALSISAEDRPLCVSTRLRVASAPMLLTPTTDEVVLSTVAMELVGPSTDPRVELIGPSFFTFVPTGADGPTDLASGTGEVTDLHFVRPRGTNRPATVTVVINGHSMDTQLGALPAPLPVTVRVSEGATYAGTVSVASGCSSVRATTIDCGGGPIMVDARDGVNYSVDATLRVSVAGDVIGVEASGVTASRRTVHEIDEHPMPATSETLTSVTSASGTRETDGRIRVRICGPTTTTVRREQQCTGVPTQTTSTVSACWDLLLAETPTVMPTELAPAASSLGCGTESPTVTGSLVRQ